MHVTSDTEYLFDDLIMHVTSDTAYLFDGLITLSAYDTVNLAPSPHTKITAKQKAKNNTLPRLHARPPARPHARTHARAKREIEDWIMTARKNILATSFCFLSPW